MQVFDLILHVVSADFLGRVAISRDVKGVLDNTDFYKPACRECYKSWDESKGMYACVRDNE